MKYLPAGDWTIRIVRPVTIVSARLEAQIDAKPAGVGDSWLTGHDKLTLIAAGEWDLALKAPAFIHDGLL